MTYIIIAIPADLAPATTSAIAKRLQAHAAMLFAGVLRDGKGQITCGGSDPPQNGACKAVALFPTYRADGWPLCPACGEDELWSRLLWDGDGERPPVASYVSAGLTCYACAWKREEEAT